MKRRMRRAGVRRFILLAIAVLAVLGRAALDGEAAQPRVERAAPPSYWEAIIRGRIGPG